MANDSSYRIHPEHDLKPMKAQDPFYCAACKEIGFGYGSGYGCPQCIVRVHKECTSPSLTMPSKLQRKEHTLEFYPDMKGENGKARFCAACSKLVRGCGYSSISGDGFHPSCLALPESIRVNNAVTRLSRKMKSECNWCGFMEICEGEVKLPSWSYARRGRKGAYHVGCVKDMMIESWRNGTFVPAKEGADAGRMHIKVDLPSKGGILGGRMGKIALRATIAGLHFDPTAFF